MDLSLIEYFFLLFASIIVLWLIKRNPWIRLSNEDVPRWVRKAHRTWESKLATHPYNRKKHFVGRSRVYRVVHGQGMQGEAPILGWFAKKRR